MNKFFSNIGCDQKCFSNLKIMTNRLEWDELTFFDCMNHQAWIFFIFGIPRLVSQHSFHLRQQKWQAFLAAPPLHQKRLHYSRYLHDNILHQEDIIKKVLHPRFDGLVDSYFYRHISYLLNFDMDDVISFDTKYFFLTKEWAYYGSNLPLCEKKEVYSILPEYPIITLNERVFNSYHF